MISYMCFKMIANTVPLHPHHNSPSIPPSLPPCPLLFQASKASKKKGAKASLGTRAVGKASKRVTDLDYENDLGAEFDDFM